MSIKVICRDQPLQQYFLRQTINSFHNSQMPSITNLNKEWMACMAMCTYFVLWLPTVYLTKATVLYNYLFSSDILIQQFLSNITAWLIILHRKWIPSKSRIIWLWLINSLGYESIEHWCQDCFDRWRFELKITFCLLQ